MKSGLVRKVLLPLEGEHTLGDVSCDYEMLTLLFLYGNISIMHCKYVPRMPQCKWNVSSIVVCDMIPVEYSMMLSHIRPRFIFISSEGQRPVPTERKSSLLCQVGLVSPNILQCVFYPSGLNNTIPAFWSAYAF